MVWVPALAGPVATGVAVDPAVPAGVAAWGTEAWGGRTLGFEVSTSSGGGAGGAKWKGTLIRLGMGLSPRMAGTNVHWRTAMSAASSTSTVTTSTASLCLRSASADGG